ncbi:MAG TPA: hypothetical protein VFZ84_13995 [Burkholderiales bacterium]|jgi:ElaB/YqjD/DUF883 family membrane-anchored ribosome-binding protein
MASTTGSTGTQKQQIDKIAESAHSAVDRATQTAAQVAERVGEKGEEWLAMKDDYVEQAREYVKENPLMALGIALAAGYLFGKITSWR